ncbi:hypothetical protein [Kitasatospora sp. NPDC087271]
MIELSGVSRHYEGARAALAEGCATRTVRMRDDRIASDSAVAA